MNTGGEAADQMVRMMLSSGEVAVRLSGSAIKNLAAISLALAQNHKTLSGKVRLGRMLRETRDLRLFPMSAEQYTSAISSPSVPGTTSAATPSPSPACPAGAR